MNELQKKLNYIIYLSSNLRNHVNCKRRIKRKLEKKKRYKIYVNKHSTYLFSFVNILKIEWKDKFFFANLRIKFLPES